ncbi:MAG: division/cell wall cluster transcriptional repressor MraZ [Candidatus Pacebacteria bacterium]|nr:division/cell wall cluster transcriptional repressor MraZ [Candidatus Paceibacterota bacterium]
MFIGKYYHKLEAKGRLSLPKKFRDQASDWVITRGLDGCLFIFTTVDLKDQIRDLTSRTLTKKAHRDLARIMANEATVIKPDNNGRVQLPEYLIKFAQLNKEIVVVGSYNRLEIWNQQRYHQYVDQLEKQAEAIAETIHE